MAYNVYVSRLIPDAGLEMLRERCARVDINPDDRAMERQELLAAVKGRHALLSQLTDKIDEELFLYQCPQHTISFATARD